MTALRAFALASLLTSSAPRTVPVAPTLPEPAAVVLNRAERRAWAAWMRRRG